MGRCRHRRRADSAPRRGSRRLLAIVSRIKTRDCESAWQAYHDAAVASRTLAEQAPAKRRTVSAREAHLWAAGYFSAARVSWTARKIPIAFSLSGTPITTLGRPGLP